MSKQLCVVALVLCCASIANAQFDWIQNPSNGHYYRLTFTSGSWQDAENEAACLGFHLVTIDDMAENDWIRDTFDPPVQGENLWIGCYQDLDDPGCTPNCEPDLGWKWISGDVLDFTNWDPALGEPNNDNGNEHWCEMYFTGFWNDNSTLPQQRGLIEAETAPEPWIQNPSNGHYYRLTFTSGSWQDAENEAACLGFHLVTIDDMAENDWIRDTFDPPVQGENLWIGCYQDLDDPGCTPNCEPDLGWKWISGDVLDFTNWDPALGEPNNDNGNEHWCEMYFTGFWNDNSTLPQQRGLIEVSVPSPIPATSEWGVAIMALLLVAGGTLVFKRSLAAA